MISLMRHFDAAPRFNIVTSAGQDYRSVFDERKFVIICSHLTVPAAKTDRNGSNIGQAPGFGE